MNEMDRKRFLGAMPSAEFPKPPPYQPVTSSDTREVDDYFDRVEREVYAVLREREWRRAAPQPVTTPKEMVDYLDRVMREARADRSPAPRTAA